MYTRFPFNQLFKNVVKHVIFDTTTLNYNSVYVLPCSYSKST